MRLFRKLQGTENNCTILSLYDIVSTVKMLVEIFKIPCIASVSRVHHLPIALVSSLLALRIENLNFALTSDLLHETRRRYRDR